jgi:hypothetical protein
VYDPPGYSQLIKVTGVKALLFLSPARRRMTRRAGPVRDEAFGQRGPASTIVEVTSLSHPDYMIEVEAIAVI